MIGFMKARDIIPNRARVHKSDPLLGDWTSEPLDTDSTDDEFTNVTTTLMSTARNGTMPPRSRAEVFSTRSSLLFKAQTMDGLSEGEEKKKPGLQYTLSNISLSSARHAATGERANIDVGWIR